MIAPLRKISKQDIAYIAGPMSGLPNFNYAAFFQCEKILIAAGVSTLNPARHPADPDTTPRSSFAIANLTTILLKATCMVVLPGWRESRGAITELLVAGELGLPAYDWEALLQGAMKAVPTTPEDMNLLQTKASSGQEDPEHINLTADRLIFGDRQDKYSHPLDDFSRIAELWTTRLGARIDPMAAIGPEDVAWMMMDLKWSRAQHSPFERDHYVDAAGYAGCAWRIMVESQRRVDEDLAETGGEEA